MHINYLFLIEMIKKNEKRGVVLDYGCGAGEVVEEALKSGINIYGVEAFYAGSNIKYNVEKKGLLGKRVFELNNDYTIPFSDNYFDMIVCNQVMEHVEDLDLTLSEISRVLKPNGLLLTLFPDNSVYREGHCGIPFIHWFPKKNHRVRYAYIFLLRLFGFGYHKKNKRVSIWAKDFLDWLDNYTFYRSLYTINNSFENTGLSINRIEADYMKFRIKKQLNRLNMVSALIPNYIMSILCRRFIGLVILAKKIQS